MRVSPEQAIANAANQSAHGPTYGVGECLWRVHDAYGVPSNGTHDAAAMWAASTAKHGQTDPHLIPRGAPVFWTGGTHGYGHVAIGAGAGRCWSTDILRPGRFDLVDIDLIRRQWGLRLVGWTEDIDGVHVFTPRQPHPLVKAALDATPGPARVAAMQRLAAHGQPAMAAKARVWLKAHANQARVVGDFRQAVS